jgi:hypothetical protein
MYIPRVIKVYDDTYEFRGVIREVKFGDIYFNEDTRVVEVASSWVTGKHPIYEKVESKGKFYDFYNEVGE